jgi:hypothetical protein
MILPAAGQPVQEFTCVLEFDHGGAEIATVGQADGPCIFDGRVSSVWKRVSIELPSPRLI